jgi:predicted aspartyl protease
MKVTIPVDLSTGLIIVDATIAGLRSQTGVRLVLDTGTTTTLLIPEVLDLLGYSPRDGGAITQVTSAIGRERGYISRVARFEALGSVRHDFPVHVFDLAERDGFDGLIGLDFLQKLDCCIRLSERCLLIEEFS